MNRFIACCPFLSCCWPQSSLQEIPAQADVSETLQTIPRPAKTKSDDSADECLRDTGSPQQSPPSLTRSCLPNTISDESCLSIQTQESKSSMQVDRSLALKPSACQALMSSDRPVNSNSNPANLSPKLNTSSIKVHPSHRPRLKYVWSTCPTEIDSRSFRSTHELGSESQLPDQKGAAVCGWLNRGNGILALLQNYRKVPLPIDEGGEFDNSTASKTLDLKQADKQLPRSDPAISCTDLATSSLTSLDSKMILPSDDRQSNHSNIDADNAN